MQNPLVPKFISSCPGEIWIGHLIYNIKWIEKASIKEDGYSYWGRCLQSAQEILLIKEMPSLGRLLDTFLHEITHALIWNCDLEASSDDDEQAQIIPHLSSEHLTALMASAWTLLWIDNPKLASWLADITKEISE